MTGENRCFRCSKISEAKHRQIVRCSALDLTAGECAALSEVCVRSLNPLYLRIRERMAAWCAAGALAAQGQDHLFGLLKRDDCVYTEIVTNAPRRTWQASIRGKVDVVSIIHTDGWRGYDGRVDMGFDRHFRVNHSRNEFAKGTHHVNDVEPFWCFAKRRLAKFNGIARHTFSLHLKACEFRSNHCHDTLYRRLLKSLREHPL